MWTFFKQYLESKIDGDYEIQNLVLEYKNKRSNESRFHFFDTETLVSSSEISFRNLCQNAISEYKYPVLKCSLALYEDRKYLKCNPNFTSEISVDKLRMVPAIYR